MLANKFYWLISLRPDAFRSKETLNSEAYKSGLFVALDIKDTENVYNVVFVNDKKQLEVMSTDKVLFEGILSDEEAMQYMPAFRKENNQTEVKIEEAPAIKGRKKKEA